MATHSHMEEIDALRQALADALNAAHYFGAAWGDSESDTDECGACGGQFDDDPEYDCIQHKPDCAAEAWWDRLAAADALLSGGLTVTP